MEEEKMKHSRILNPYEHVKPIGMPNKATVTIECDMVSGQASTHVEPGLPINITIGILLSVIGGLTAQLAGQAALIIKPSNDNPEEKTNGSKKSDNDNTGGGECSATGQPTRPSGDSTA
jgi:hypothetical protein